MRQLTRLWNRAIVCQGLQVLPYIWALSTSDSAGEGNRFSWDCKQWSYSAVYSEFLSQPTCGDDQQAASVADQHGSHADNIILLCPTCLHLRRGIKANVHDARVYSFELFLPLGYECWLSNQFSVFVKYGWGSFSDINFAHFLIFAHSYHGDNGSQSVKEFIVEKRDNYTVTI